MCTLQWLRNIIQSSSFTLISHLMLKNHLNFVPQNIHVYFSRNYPPQQKKKCLHRWHNTKEPTCQCRRLGRYGCDPWVGEMPWCRKWQSALVFLPGKVHGQRRLVGYSPWSCKESYMTKHITPSSPPKKISFSKNDASDTPCFSRASWIPGIPNWIAQF